MTTAGVTVAAVAAADLREDRPTCDMLASLWTEAFAPQCTPAEAARRIDRYNYTHAIIGRDDADGTVVAGALVMPNGPSTPNHPLHWDFHFLTMVAVRKGHRRRGLCGAICGAAMGVAGESEVHRGHLRPLVLHIYTDEDAERGFSMESVYGKYGFRVASRHELAATGSHNQRVCELDGYDEARMIRWPPGGGLTFAQRIDVEELGSRLVERYPSIWPQLAALWSEAFPGGKTEEEWIDAIRGDAKLPYSFILVARLDDGPVMGAAMLTPNEPPLPPPEGGEEADEDGEPTSWDSVTISAVAVAPAWRLRGVCGILCQHAVKAAGYSRIHAWIGRPLVLHLPPDGDGPERAFERYGFRIATDYDLVVTSTLPAAAKTTTMIRWPHDQEWGGGGWGLEDDSTSSSGEDD